MNTKAIIGVQPELPYSVEEAINRLRINVSFFGRDIRKIMVVSSEPNEGKSFVAMSLWKQMALAGEKTILIDADLRKSVMVKKYGISREDGKELWGLSHFLSDNKKLVDCVLSTDMPCGDLLPNVNNLINPSMLLESERFGKMLDLLAERYRYVFLDVPPLGLVSDAERIGHLCDGAILTVRSGVTPKSLVKTSLSQLERAGCPLLGVVLNRTGSGKGKYYGKYYGRYYGKYYGKYYGSKYGEEYYKKND